MSSSDRINYLTFFVNGKQIIEHNAQPEWTLLWYLRNSKYSICQRMTSVTIFSSRYIKECREKYLFFLTSFPSDDK